MPRFLQGGGVKISFDHRVKKGDGGKKKKKEQCLLNVSRFRIVKGRWRRGEKRDEKLFKEMIREKSTSERLRPELRRMRETVDHKKSTKGKGD